MIILLVYLISNEIITYLDMSSFLPTGMLSVVPKQHHALIILIHDIILDLEPLPHDKQSTP